MPGTRSAHAAPLARHVRRPLRALIPALALLVLAAGCGSSESLKGDVVKDGIGCQPTEVARRDDAPVIPAKYKVGKKTSSVDQKKGKGCPTDSTSFLTLDLVGTIASTGKVFTSTWTSGHPFTTQLGKGQLIAGLETGLIGMKVGGRRILAIPAAEAYGAGGSPEQHIGKNVDIVFAMDLISVTQTPVYCAAAQPYPLKDEKGKPFNGKPQSVDMPVKVPVDKVITKDLEVGEGEKVGKNRYVTVDYLGLSCLDGKQFDSSWDRGTHLTAALGTATPSGDAGTVIPGWSSGLETARVGGLRQMEIPFPLAYGSQGGNGIGADASLVFVVRILSVSDKAPKATTTTTSTTAPAATPTTAAGSGSTTTTSAAATTTTTEAAATTTTTKK
jgi:peptidylprolyl isomerase